jgi:hypothetical protein
LLSGIALSLGLIYFIESVACHVRDPGLLVMRKTSHSRKTIGPGSQAVIMRIKSVPLRAEFGVERPAVPPSQQGIHNVGLLRKMTTVEGFRLLYPASLLAADISPRDATTAVLSRQQLEPSLRC